MKRKSCWNRARMRRAMLKKTRAQHQAGQTHYSSIQHCTVSSTSTFPEEGNVGEVMKMINLKEVQKAVAKPYSIENLDSSPSSTSLVKIEIDNPERSSCNITDGSSYFEESATPLEYIEVKTEIDESEFTQQELGGEEKELECGKKKRNEMNHFSVRPLLEHTAWKDYYYHDLLDPIVQEKVENGYLEVSPQLLENKHGQIQSSGASSSQSFLTSVNQSKEGLKDQATAVRSRSMKDIQSGQFDRNGARKEHSTKNPFACEVCDRSFTSYPKLMCHCIDDHDMRNVYICTLCKQEFTDESEYKTHKALHVEYDYMMNYSTCPVCCIEFTKREDLDRHLVCHTSAMTLSCESDDKTCMSHRRGNSSTNTCHICPVCKNIYEASEDLLEHLKSHKKPFKCLECDEAYYYHELLVSHMSRHARGRSKVCYKCNKSFPTTQDYKNHCQQFHLKLLKCSDCCEEFDSAYEYQVHLKTHKVNQCNICGKFYSTKTTLEVHMRIHRGEKRYQCSLCGKAFSQQHLLKSHLRMHNGENPFKCNICEKAYRHKISLKNHLNRHAMKDRELNVCQASLNVPIANENIEDSSGNVGKIENIENGDQAVNSNLCPECGKGFKTGAGLKRHINSHGRTKIIHQCKECGKISTTKGNLSVHMRIHTGEKPFKCLICHKCYRQSHLLKYHMVKHNEALMSQLQQVDSGLTSSRLG